MLPKGSTAKLSSVPNSTDFETVDEVETPTSYLTELERLNSCKNSNQSKPVRTVGRCPLVLSISSILFHLSVGFEYSGVMRHLSAAFL